jgi:hypothetical protein
MMSEKLRAIVEREFYGCRQSGEAAFEGGNWRAEINLHISVGIAGKTAFFERFVDLPVAIL